MKRGQCEKGIGDSLSEPGYLALMNNKCQNMYPYYKGESATKVLGKGHDDVMMDDKLVPLLLGSELVVNTQK